MRRRWLVREGLARPPGGRSPGRTRGAGSGPPCPTARSGAPPHTQCVGLHVGERWTMSPEEQRTGQADRAAGEQGLPGGRLHAVYSPCGVCSRTRCEKALWSVCLSRLLPARGSADPLRRTGPRRGPPRLARRGTTSPAPRCAYCPWSARLSTANLPSQTPGRYAGQALPRSSRLSLERPPLS